MIGAENVKFQASDVDAGDPGKLKYLHAGRPGYPEWHAKPFSQVSQVDPRGCPGCMFPDAPPGKWPHVKDSRCAIWPTPSDLVMRAISRQMERM
jgi:hypothetical protein